MLANLQPHHKQDDKKSEQHLPTVSMVEKQFPDLGIKDTAGLWDRLFNPATQDGQTHCTNAGKKIDFASLLPVSPSAKAPAAVKKHTENNQGNGKMNTYGMQQDNETGVKRGYRNAFINPTDTDGQHMYCAYAASAWNPSFMMAIWSSWILMPIPSMENLWSL